MEVAVHPELPVSGIYPVPPLSSDILSSEGPVSPPSNFAAIPHFLKSDHILTLLKTPSCLSFPRLER